MRELDRPEQGVCLARVRVRLFKHADNDARLVLGSDGGVAAGCAERRQHDALANSHPYHVGCLLPLPRRGRIDWRAAARTECLQAWMAALGRGLEVCRRLARYAKGRTGNGNIDAEGGAGADLAI